MARCKGHGRYHYSAITERPVYDWPGGKRLAVYVAMNLECFSFGEGLGAALAPGGPEPDVLNYAWRDYGNRVGAFRLATLLQDLGLPVAVLVNSDMYEEAPAAIDAFRAGPHEIVAHGRTNAERQGVLPEAEEAALIAEATQTIARHEGAAPKGWLGPWISQSRVTPDLLAEAGYTYHLDWCHDDQPITMTTRSGDILSVPYPQELNDIPAIVARRQEMDAFAAAIIDTFEVLRAEAATRPLVMGIALHPYIVGWPHRAAALRRALTHMVEAADPLVWFTTPGAIAKATPQPAPA